ncbi:PREDICTED: uncharacterized protein LOC104712742 isoform X1 [Camelina sativa]|uniref:Uncharacterized protein LOC104712742 isoform X1 n=1 Tax=Camelina sativa TaxID=90675 RepID=A0ABM0TL61_CAMSA|nr:PREDICTED: uncharacterized protein LOC104712742 isoform X1 [Camelina sativa]
MASTVFIALQCFECSTMQVKQKKKSSNKWVCVICNQKQSVKKVFAQGFKAKDLRFFVQSFNMSRKVSDEEALGIVDSEVDVKVEVDDEEVLDVREKKRSDWSEYLDCDSSNGCSRLTGEEEEDDVKIVTEMPKDMFKRPKLNKYSSPGGSSSVTGGGKKRDGYGLFKPPLPRRSVKKPDFCSDGVMMRKEDKEQRKLESESERVIKPASKWDAYLIDGEGEHQAPSFSLSKATTNVVKCVIFSVSVPFECVADAVRMRKEDIEQENLESERVTKPVSKWDAYLIDDEGEHQAPPRFGGKKGLKDDDVEEWDKAVMEMSTECQIVDEEVHPDFM